jgi:hypothetical protein
MINFSEKAYEMCLMNYDLAILDNAFLVPAPGIKLYIHEMEDKRKPYVILKSKAEAKIMSHLKKKYETKNDCRKFLKIISLFSFIQDYENFFN